MKEWKKAHGDRAPVPGSESWDHLVRQSREIDRQKGVLYQAEEGKNKVVRGFLTREGMKHSITFTPHANWSTFLHESAHRFFLVLEHLASLDNAPQAIKDDHAAILKWLGIEHVGQMTDAHHAARGRGDGELLRQGGGAVRRAPRHVCQVQGVDEADVQPAHPLSGCALRRGARRLRPLVCRGC